MSTFELVMAICYPMILLVGIHMIAMLAKIHKIVAETFNIHDVKDPRRPGAYVWYSHDEEMLEELRAIKNSLNDLVTAMERRSHDT